MKCDDFPPKTVLLVDDEEHILDTTKLCMKSCGLNDVWTISDSRKVLPLLDEVPISVIVLDLHMPYVSGVELLPSIIKNYPHIPVILVTANDEINMVVDCIKMGAFDYVVKPVDFARLLASIRKALEMSGMCSQMESLKQRLLTDKLDNPDIFSSIVTDNKKMRAIFQYVEVVSATRQPIMITGETGTGKELMARAIHELSCRPGELVALNVAGLDDNMFSDTLFGHKKGSFTGADQSREGLIARASGGTLFLDEIGDLSETSQIKLLRLLQEKEYYPVGSDVVKKSDARIILATNRDLKGLIAAGKFRNDLYYRLCAHQVQLPPLRERLDDIPLLLDHFLTAAAAEFGKKKPTPPNELVTLLQLYSFPGNIRELEAQVFEAVARHESGILSMDSFRNLISDERQISQTTSAIALEENSMSAIFGHFPTIREVEDYLIKEAMKQAKDNQGMAASLLGMTRQTLNNRLKGAKME